MSEMNSRLIGLEPKIVYVGEGRGDPNVPVDRGSPPSFMGDAIYLSRGFQGRTVTINTTPVLIQRSTFAHPYMILNPSRSVGLTNSFLISSGTKVAAGNTQAAPSGVANFMGLHFFLDVTAVSGTWDFFHQARDPGSGNFADIQTIFAGLTATGTYYAFVGALGVPVDIAVRWNPTIAGSITFTLTGVLKEGTIGSAGGLSQTVYLGADQNVAVGFGFPILEGQKYTFVLGENIELWGVAEVSVTVNVFEL